ncbi:MAG: hypothetical protein KGJ86_16150, partial [Chloroflexota bacterium]|nr:hypothetical protein [Chloroflexota bacterium]
PAAASGFSAALLGYWVACDSVGDEDGTGGAVAHQWRLFRNRRGIRFRGRIHEEPIPPDTSRPLNVLRQDAVLVRHWGYVPNPEVIARKRERNERLLQRAIAEDPDNAYNYFSFGEQKVWEEDFDQAGAYLQKARELWRKSGSLETPFVGPMFSMSAYAAMQLNHHQECLDIEREAPPEFFSSDLLCCTGMACWRLGRRDEAIARLERAATDPGLKGVGFLTDPSTSTWKPRLFLARFHLELGLKDQAYEWARQAMEHLPARPEIALGWAALLAQRGDREEATRWLLQVLDQPGENEHKPRARKLLLELAQAGNDDTAILRACEGAIQGLAEPERALTQAAAYGRLGRLQDQYDVLDRACREYPAAAAIRLALADILEAAGYADQALPVVAAGIDLPDPPVSLYLRLAGLLAKLGRAEDAANARTLATLVASRQ